MALGGLVTLWMYGGIAAEAMICRAGDPLSGGINSFLRTGPEILGQLAPGMGQCLKSPESPFSIRYLFNLLLSDSQLDQTAAAKMTSSNDLGYMDENKGPWLYAIFLTLLVLSLFTVALRVYCRLRYLKMFQTSDYLIVAAMVTTCGMSAMIGMQIKTGMGRHIEYSEGIPGMLIESMKVGYAQNILYQLSVGIVKSSILAQYHCIASNPTQRKTILAVWALVVVWCAFVTLAAVFQCIPISAIFNPDTFPAGCWNMQNVNLATSSVNLMVDLVIFVLPLPILAKLQMERRKKVALVATYFFGSLSIAASALRISSMVLWNGNPDFTYVSAVIPVYDAVEINTGIICGCIPLLRPLIKVLVSTSVNSLSTGSKWIRTKSMEQEVDEIPLSSTGRRNQSKGSMSVFESHV